MYVRVITENTQLYVSLGDGNADYGEGLTRLISAKATEPQKSNFTILLLSPDAKI